MAAGLMSLASPGRDRAQIRETLQPFGLARVRSSSLPGTAAFPGLP